jgi:hypothetical protein
MPSDIPPMQNFWEVFLGFRPITGFPNDENLTEFLFWYFIPW